MTETTQPCADSGSEIESLERPASVFLYLGEQLRAFAHERRISTVPTDLPPDAAEALFRTIEGEIIPRLMLAHKARDARDRDTNERGAAITAEDHAHFLKSVMQETPAETRKQIQELVARGVTREAIFLELLTAAARRLGQLWEEDLCDFTDVTIGLCRLHQVVRETGLFPEDEVHAPGNAPRILLATACADQHVLGVVMVGEFFRRAGWRVRSEPGATRAELAAVLRAESVDILGLSAACTTRVDDVADELQTLRRVACNPALRVLVGGRLFVEAPELVERAGADGTAADARLAPAAGHALLTRADERC